MNTRAAFTTTFQDEHGELFSIRTHDTADAPKWLVVERAHQQLGQYFREGKIRPRGFLTVTHFESVAA